MPTPHLHPRSRMTSSLFATTLFASFFVVALPHVLPCPAPRGSYADGELADPNGKRRRRRKSDVASQDAQQQQSQGGSVKAEEVGGSRVTVRDGVAQFNEAIAKDDGPVRKNMRECPVPKPAGTIGTWLRFKQDTTDDNR